MGLRAIATTLASIALVSACSASGAGAHSEGERLLATLPVLQSETSFGHMPPPNTDAVVSVTTGTQQGVLSIADVEKVLKPSGAFSAALASNGGDSAARVDYRLTFKEEINPKGDYVLDIDTVAIKFPTAAKGLAFAQTVARVESSLGVPAKPVANMEPGVVTAGVLPSQLQQMKGIVPASGPNGQTYYSFYAQLLEPDGTYYLGIARSTFNYPAPMFIDEMKYLDANYANCRLNGDKCGRKTANQWGPS
ncbi:hypothetical protein Back2_27570 [Nocardioides baekrokdamisoli]|uniref:Lipoprotein n=1 Tax=Nocardioides baekrokdamisoli TaxID=1804624 RepID=A0A3G9IHD6_9ACTN|nr:hypothetical protein [Nocardioides baekrokdamisoli]BBH18470.1 hypothetical protein Back2_27570 [Nocardioides baekrokdamisoli]